MAAVYKYNSVNKVSVLKVQIDRVNGFPTKQSDDFCWSCHRDNPKLFCTSCIRSYHAVQFCSGSKKLSAEETRSWKCPVCIDIETDVQLMRTKQIKSRDVCKLLSFVLTRIKTDEHFADVLMDLDYSRVSEKVVQPMDLRMIEQNVDDFAYRCYEAFLSDIKWIVHNVKVHSQLVPHAKTNALKIVKWLLDMTKEEIYSIRMCDECYIGIVQTHRFDMVCKQPHLIVWAKQRGYPYWPAKLMSTNVAKNTVDVRYFGEKHFRAIVAPKDCYLYSAERPSLHLGTQRKAFEKALVEVDLYVKRIREVYGTFNLAAANTPLLVNMLERHLYDTIPKAWIALGKTVIPSPIKTVATAAAARISRRHSIASRSIIAPPQPMPPIPTSAGRIVARRMSSRINQINGSDDDHGDVDAVKKSQKLFARRQSVQVDMLNAGKRNFWNDTDTHGERIAALSGTSRKRKFGDDDNNKAATLNQGTKQTTTLSADESVFKVPEIPQKIRKVATTGAKESNSTLEIPPPMASNSSPPQNEFDVSFGTIIADNNAKMADGIRSVMDGMLHEFWCAAQPWQSQLQALKSQLSTMQTEHTRQMDELRREKNSLNQKLNTLTGKFDVQSLKMRETMQMNVELMGSQREAKLKMTALTMDLKKCADSNAELRNNLNQLCVKNGECQATIDKLRKQHEAAQQLLLDAESKVDRLETENRALCKKNIGLELSVQWAEKKHENTLLRLKDVERRCNLEKSAAFEQCYNIINDNKKRQWCATCQKSGGHYYCSSKCEEKYWRTNRQ